MHYMSFPHENSHRLSWQCEKCKYNFKHKQVQSYRVLELQSYSVQWEAGTKVWVGAPKFGI